MIINRQHQVALNLAGIRAYERRIRKKLDLAGREFNVAFIDDGEMMRLNASHRGRNRTTDVLSFQWESLDVTDESGEFGNFLGDIVISVTEAGQNARREGHPIEQEIRWLILHGVLHLLGYDHEQDNGEMKALELSLRDELQRNGRKVRRLEAAPRG